MEKTSRRALHVWLLLLTLGCTSDPIQPEPVTFFPLTIGSRWIYSVEQEEIRLGTGEHMSGGVHSWDTLTVTRTENWDGRMVTLIESRAWLPHGYLNEYVLYHSFHYYANLATGLYQFGERNPGGGSNPVPGLPEPVLRDKRQKNVDEDEVHLYSPPLYVLAYPPVIGARWHYINAATFTEYPIRANKEIIGRKIIRTIAGSFDCYEVLVEYDFDFDGAIDDDWSMTEFFSAEGLIERIVKSKGEIRDGNSGEVIDSTLTTTTYRLNEYSLGH